MRRGFASLSLQVQETLRMDPFSGHLFIFRGRRGDLIKCIWRDGQGACLFAKRLEKGLFRWPSACEGARARDCSPRRFCFSASLDRPRRI
jgi:transposase